MRKVCLAVLLVLVCAISFLVPTTTSAATCPSSCSLAYNICINSCFSHPYPECTVDCYMRYRVCCPA